MLIVLQKSYDFCNYLCAKKFFIKMIIRQATIQDAPQLLRIYAYYVQNTAVTFEWEVPSVDDFASRIAKVIETYPYLVADDEGTIKGYAYASRFRVRKAYDWCVESSIYIDKDYRRQNVGSKLLTELERILKLQGVTNIIASIATTCDPNDKYLTDASLHFHERHGYRFVGELRKCGYKFHRWYNTMWTEKFIGEHSEKPKVFRKIDEIDI